MDAIDIVAFVGVFTTLFMASVAAFQLLASVRRELDSKIQSLDQELTRESARRAVEDDRILSKLTDERVRLEAKIESVRSQAKMKD